MSHRNFRELEAKMGPERIAKRDASVKKIIDEIKIEQGKSDDENCTEERPDNEPRPCS